MIPYIVTEITEAAERARRIFEAETSWREEWLIEHPSLVFVLTCSDDRMLRNRLMLHGRPEDFPNLPREDAAKILIPHGMGEVMRNIGASFRWETKLSNHIMQKVIASGRAPVVFLILSHSDGPNNAKHGCYGMKYDLKASRRVIEDFASVVRRVFGELPHRHLAVFTGNVDTSVGDVTLYGADDSILSTSDLLKQDRRAEFDIGMLQDRLHQIQNIGHLAGYDVATFLASNMASMRLRNGDNGSMPSFPHAARGVGYGRFSRWLEIGQGPPLLKVNSHAHASKTHFKEALQLALKGAGVDEVMVNLSCLPFTANPEWPFVRRDAIELALDSRRMTRHLISEHCSRGDQARFVDMAAIVDESTMVVEFLD